MFPAGWQFEQSITLRLDKSTPKHELIKATLAAIGKHGFYLTHAALQTLPVASARDRVWTTGTFDRRSARKDFNSELAELATIEANRRNGLRSTGPRSRSGKQRARANALRHGLSGETVITVLEDAEE